MTSALLIHANLSSSWLSESPMHSADYYTWNLFKWFTSKNKVIFTGNARTYGTASKITQYIACTRFCWQHQCHGVMNLRNIYPRAGFEPNPLVFWTGVLTITPQRLPDTIALPYSRPSVYLAACLRGQCRLLYICSTSIILILWG